MKSKRKELPPHWKLDGEVKRCSVCGFPLQVVGTPGNVEEIFKEHLLKSHRPGQTSEDANQAAFRVVREATKDV